MHREFQGTRILRGSGVTTLHRQTVIIINIFSLNYMMCVEGGSREGEKTTNRQRERRLGGWEMRAEETNQTDVAVKVKVWEGEK